MEKAIRRLLFEQVLLNESYPFTSNSGEYEFTNKDGLHFHVRFYNQGDGYYVRCYGTKEYGESEINGTDAFGILSTVSKITLDFIKKYQPVIIQINHNNTKKEHNLSRSYTNKRALANKRFLERIIPDNYTYELNGSSSTIRKKSDNN